MAGLPGAAGAAGIAGVVLPADAWRLASLVVPGLGRGERARLGRALGLVLTPDEPRDPAQAQQEAALIAAACQERLTALEPATLQQLNRIFFSSRLPEARAVEAALREKVRAGFTGASTEAGESEPDGGLLGGRVSFDPPLQQAKTRKRVDEARIQQALSPGGGVSQALPAYEARAGQVKMARAVTRALNDQFHLIVEAGTGTGKSLAYLVPAVEHALANGRRVVVSTNTINLQEQLFFKDIPLLRLVVQRDFRAAVLKGRSNYLCLRRWRSFLREGLAVDSDRLLAAKILLWLRETETGDRSELALDDVESARWAAALAADALHCTAQTCRDNRIGRCFLSRARRRAEAAHLLVVNHALLLADQALESKVLPEYADLIIDEAHHLEDAATSQLGVDIAHQELAFFLASVSLQQGPGRYVGLVSRLQTVLITAGGPPMRNEAGELTQPAHDASEVARHSLQELFAALAAFVRNVIDAPAGPVMGERDVRLVATVRQTPEWDAVRGVWEQFSQDMGTLEGALSRVEGALEPFKGTAELVDDAMADLAGARRQITEVRTNLTAIVALPREEEVSWVSVRDRGIALRSAPIEVGPLLEEQLFSQKDTVVLASATLQVGGSFRYVRERLGLDPATFTLAVPSPFDYQAQALLCVPGDLPEPSSRAFQDAAHEALAAICTATGGRTLILFTSHAALRAAHDYLRRRFRQLVVLGQGIDGSRQQLLSRFRETPTAVLLGTSSFWEGIDVVGDALSCLVIVKLPFTVPNDPVFAARSELFDDPFFQYAVPQAALRLKQGFGRLIRSGSDRGIAILLDSRIWTKRYGEVFLRSLPPASQRRCSWQDLGQLAREWLDQPNGSAAPPPGVPASVVDTGSRGGSRRQAGAGGTPAR